MYTDEITVGDFTYRITRFGPFKSLDYTRKLGKFILPAIAVMTDPEMSADTILAVGQLLTEDDPKNGLDFNGVLKMLLFSDNIEVRHADGDFHILKEIKKEMSFESMSAIIEVLVKVLQVNFTDIIKDYIPQFGSVDLKSLIQTALAPEEAESNTTPST